MNYILTSSLHHSTVDWLLVIGVACALLFLLVCDMAFMNWFNVRLNEAAKEAETANRAKSDFLSTMSHDIRTPMNAILGLTTIAQRNVDDPAVVEDSLHKIGLASSHLLTLINDILDISKVESGKLSLTPVVFSIAEVAENLVNISQPMVKEKDIDFHFHVNAMEYEYLYADQLRINQVFINVLSNSLKYTEPCGSVIVDLREQEGKTSDEVRLVYCVADTGIGMSEEFMERMYESFSRQTDSRVDKVQGTGLGLAITKQMVDLMEGKIECKSKEGEGTTFTITLDVPIAQREDEKMTLDSVGALIVDDDEDLLQTAKLALDSLDAHAEVASSGSQALEMVRTRHDLHDDYNVIIVDSKMPNMDGIETVRRVRAIVGEQIPIIVSAYDWSGIEESAKEAGVDGFVSKPFFRSTLYRTINELLHVTSSPAVREDDYSDIEGMRVLVAEDNDLNWQIFSTLLGMHGIEATHAEDGQIAIDMLASSKPGDYDLVFMDVQMPVMNGIEATKAIRALPNERVSAIPIIATTANAFSEDVTACLDAGMNGHIAKPIDIQLVLKEIRRVKECKS